jgi:hypothetical protein
MAIHESRLKELRDATEALLRAESDRRAASIRCAGMTEQNALAGAATRAQVRVDAAIAALEQPPAPKRGAAWDALRKPQRGDTYPEDRSAAAWTSWLGEAYDAGRTDAAALVRNFERTGTFTVPHVLALAADIEPHPAAPATPRRAPFPVGVVVAMCDCGATYRVGDLRDATKCVCGRVRL